MTTISIVMPAFNSDLYIHQAIKSIQNQSYSDWELLVVDGGSIDETLRIIGNFLLVDNRIKLIINQDDQGPAHARATGVLNASGTYIAFLDADDLWLPEKLDLQISFMKKNNYLFSYTSYRKMDADGVYATCPITTHTRFNFILGLARRGIGSPTVMILKELFDEHILKTIGKFHGEETLWWLLMLKKGVVAHCLTESLALYRDTPNSLSKKIVRNQVSVWHSYRNELGVPFCLAIITYCSYMIDVLIRRFRLRLCTLIRGKVLVASLIK